jgi:hypothetical protein
MLLNQEFEILEVLFIALLIYGVSWLAIRQLSNGKRQEVLSRYGELRKQSLELQKITSNYILSEDMSNRIMKGEITYTEFYRQLKHSHVSNLSDKCLQKIKYSNNLLSLKKAEQRLQHEEERLAEARSLISYIQG